MTPEILAKWAAWNSGYNFKINFPKTLTKDIRGTWLTENNLNYCNLMFLDQSEAESVLFPFREEE